jgi:5'-methylthioinosine phosphorylase
MLAIIGGSGLAKLAELTQVQRKVMRTPYGDPSCALTFGKLDDQAVVFLARHGYGHTIAPHEINYRANLWALKEAGVQRVVAVATVGGIRKANDSVEFEAGSLCIPDQIIDYTWGRKHTFFEGSEQPVTHVDFTHPYSATLRASLIAAAARNNVDIIAHGTYGCTQGPRLETAAEILRMGRDGCDLVGMTGMPEAALARELGLDYAAIAVVVNPAAGQGASAQGISFDAIKEVMEQGIAQVRRLLSDSGLHRGE